MLRTKDAREGALAATEACDAHGVSFKMVPDMRVVQMDHHLGLPAYHIKHASLTRANFMTKRALDIVFSTALLLATAPF